MDTIVQVLMERDDMSREDAQDLFDQAQVQFYEYMEDGEESAAYDICSEFFGLEPDYIGEFF